MRYEPHLRLGVSHAVDTVGADAVVVCSDSAVMTIDMRSGRELARRAIRHPIALDVTLTGDRIAVANTAGRCEVLDAAGLECLMAVSGRGMGEGCGPVLGPTGIDYLQGSWNGRIAVREVATGALIASHREPDRMIEQIAASPDRTMIAYASSGAGGTVIRTVRYPFDELDVEDVLVLERGVVQGLTLNGAGLLAVRQPLRLSVWSLDTGAQLSERPAHISGTEEGLAWLSDDMLVATDSDEDARDYVRFMDSGLGTLEEHIVSSACAIAASSDARYVVVGSTEDGAVLKLVQPAL